MTLSYSPYIFLFSHTWEFFADSIMPIDSFYISFFFALLFSVRHRRRLIFFVVVVFFFKVIYTFIFYFSSLSSFFFINKIFFLRNIRFLFSLERRQWDNIKSLECYFSLRCTLPTHGKIGFQGHFLYFSTITFYFFSLSPSLSLSLFLMLLLLLLLPFLSCCDAVYLYNSFYFPSIFSSILQVCFIVLDSFFFLFWKWFLHAKHYSLIKLVSLFSVFCSVLLLTNSYL